MAGQGLVHTQGFLGCDLFVRVLFVVSILRNAVEALQDRRWQGLLARMTSYAGEFATLAPHITALLEKLVCVCLKP